MRRFLLFLIFSLCLGKILAYDFEVDGLAYEITSNIDVETGVTEYLSYQKKISIPLTVSYDSKVYSVTGISEYAFKDCSSLKEIQIPESILIIGDQAFSGCARLIDIKIPKTTEELGKNLFINTPKMRSIHWEPNSNVILKSGTFSNCEGKTLYLYSNQENRERVHELKESLESQFKKIIIREL